MIEIEEVRELPFVGNWYRPPARSTLMRLTKADLIEYIALAFKNWHGTEEALNWSIEYHRFRDKDENQSHNCEDCKEVHQRTRERDIAKSKYKELAKESDELKAKFASAERCIEEIESVMSVSVISECAEGEKVNGIIRAYREAKEAK